MSSASEFCIPANPDLTGIGVRVAMYAQNILSFVPAVWKLNDRRVSTSELQTLEAQSSTILITGFAILISAIIQATTTAGLSDFHAIVVLNLSWMNNTSLFIYLLLFTHHVAERLHDAEKADPSSSSTSIAPSDPSSSPTSIAPSHSPLHKRIMMRWALLRMRCSDAQVPSARVIVIIGSLHLSAMAAVGVWLWSHPLAFGNSDPCTLSVSTVILGGKIPIGSAALRAWSILIYALLLIPVVNLVFPILLLAIPYIIFDRGSIIKLTKGMAPNALLRRTPIYIGFSILLAINVIFIINTELQLSWNRALRAQGDDDWTFGQTLAVGLLFLPLRDIVESIVDRWEIQRSKEEAQKERMRKEEDERKEKTREEEAARKEREQARKEQIRAKEEERMRNYTGYV
ncbi:hypothetical protein BDZ89DRAFT_1079620 [Hymenopellis radicata]|nr:hypothetical protein BDZ89DRAFT_1079620 [Hymenopellis radicata]